MSARKSRTIVSEVDAAERRSFQRRVAQMLDVARKERLPVETLAERYDLKISTIQHNLHRAGVTVESGLLNLKPSKAGGTR